MEIGNLNQRITILEHRTVIDEISNHITPRDQMGRNILPVGKCDRENSK